MSLRGLSERCQKPLTQVARYDLLARSVCADCVVGCLSGACAELARTAFLLAPQMLARTLRQTCLVSACAYFLAQAGGFRLRSIGLGSVFRVHPRP